MGQAWKWCTSLCPHCIVDSVTWPYPTVKETRKCNKLCAWKEEKVGFGEHTAISAPKTLAYGLTFMSLNFLTYEMVKWEQYCLSHSVIVKNIFVKCLVWCQAHNKPSGNNCYYYCIFFLSFIHSFYQKWKSMKDQIFHLSRKKFIKQMTVYRKNNKMKEKENTCIVKNHIYFIYMLNIFWTSIAYQALCQRSRDTEINKIPAVGVTTVWE